MTKNHLKAAFHLGIINSGGSLMSDEAYDRMLADIARKEARERDAEQDRIDEQLSLDANGWDS